MEIIQSNVEFFKQQDGQRVARGFERQRYVLHDDQTVCLNVFSVASDLGITREVTLNLDGSWRPLDSYVRIHHGQRLEGSAWFRFSASQVTAKVQHYKEGASKQAMPVGKQGAVFCAHPIATDALIAAAYQRDDPTPTQLLPEVFLSSPHHFGATGPELAKTAIEMTYLGSEEIVAAGQTFDADHYQIMAGNQTTGHTHPGEDLWTLKDTFVFLKAEIAALGYVYELQSLVRDRY